MKLSRLIPVEQDLQHLPSGDKFFAVRMLYDPSKKKHWYLTDRHKKYPTDECALTRELSDQEIQQLREFLDTAMEAPELTALIQELVRKSTPLPQHRWQLWAALSAEQKAVLTAEVSAEGEMGQLSLLRGS